MKRVACPLLALLALLAGLSANCANGRVVELVNDEISLGFDPALNYSLTALINRAQDTNFIADPPERTAQDRSLWALYVVGNQGTERLTPADAESASHAVDGDTLTITWRGIRNPEAPGSLTVTATIRLPKDSQKATFRAEVSGNTQGWLRQLDFPRVTGIRDFADSQMALPYYWGRLVQKPMQLGRRGTLAYPEPASMQWFAYWGTEDKRQPELAQEEGRNAESGWSPDYSDACGLYWAAEDGGVYTKRFAYDPTLDGEQLGWHIENIPALNTWPIPKADKPVPCNYKMPYDVAVATFTGDWHEGAQLYLAWAKDQKWAQRGPVDRWPKDTPKPGSDELMRWTPPWFQDIGFWAKFYHEPAKILPEWAAYRKWLRVPMASHWYRYNIATFNDNDPEHLPPDPYVLDGVRAAREMGVEPMPYVLATIWDTDTQSWIRENGQRSALRDENGSIPPWNIGKNVFANMCFAQEQWHAKMREICRKLVWEHGMSGIYLDVLAAGRARLCYNPEHGHSIHGGNYWGNGARELMEKLRTDIRRFDPDACFFSEEIGEHLFDVMDGFLTLDLTRNYTPGGEQVWPILTAVYHPYTINFGSDAQIGMDPEAFAVLYGRQVVWGSQPLHSAMVMPEPSEDNPTAVIFREYTRAYWVAGKPFLMGGEMMRLGVRPREASPGRCGLELATESHIVPYDLNKDRDKLWSGPAIMGSAWKRHGDIGIVLANTMGTRQTAALTVRQDALGLKHEKLVRLWPGSPGIIGGASGEHAIVLEPWQCAVLAITSDPETAIKRLNPLEDTSWEFGIVTEGPLPEARGEKDTLFACSDGPVRNTISATGTVAVPCRIDADGNVVRREGHQAERRGHKAESHGLPRDLDKQPFALLRRLSHGVTGEHIDVTVLSGAENHVLAIAEGPVTLQFSSKGLLVITDEETGNILRPISDVLTDRTDVPKGRTVRIGWARFDQDSVTSLSSFGDKAFSHMFGPVATQLAGLMSCLPNRREAELASVSRRFVDLARNLGDLPGALSPMSPLTPLHEAMNALVSAHLGMDLRIAANHRWLAAGIDKALSVRVRGGNPKLVNCYPIGNWDASDMSVIVVSSSEGLGATDFALRLNDGLYIERVVPIVGVASVERNGLTHMLSSVLLLEANRPYQLVYDKTPLVTVADKQRKASVILRNWSPIDLELSIRELSDRDVPSGQFEIIPTAPILRAPALSDIPVDILITPRKSARAGRHDIRMVLNHATGAQNTDFYADLPVTVLSSMVPLHENVADWTRPAPEERARIRKGGLFAVYAQLGQTIGCTIENIRVTKYVDTLSWHLLSPTMDLVKKGRIQVDKTATIKYQAEVAGTYYLEVVPKSGSADVTFTNRIVAESATREHPLQLFCSPLTRHFLVPSNAREFQLVAQDGGPTEGARLIVTSPSGRTALDIDGNHNGTPYPVRVEPNEAGKVWTLRIEPKQDVSICLTGDVVPYLSTSPKRILTRDMP